MDTGATVPLSGKKRAADGIVLTDIKCAAAHDSDSDFKDDGDEAKKPKRKAPATKMSSLPNKGKRVPRLQFAGQRDADKCMMAARDNGSSARVIAVTLDWNKDTYLEANRVLKAMDFTGRFCYKLDQNTQSYLSPDEFLGFFYTEASGEPGLGKVIAELLLESDDNHVVVVDGTPKGEEFARLAALVAAHFFKLLPGGNNELWKAVRKFPNRNGQPVHPHWAAAVQRMSKCKSEILLRTAMKEHYDEYLAHVSPFE